MAIPGPSLSVADDNNKDLSPDDRIIKQAKRRFAFAEEWFSSARDNGQEDRKFVHGDSNNNWQWPGDVMRSRRMKQQVALTVNKTRQHCLQIINEARKNKPGITVHPVGDDASYEAAQIYEGIIRYIEYNSRAQ